MTWLVFGISCLLILAGAVSVTSGAPIIQLERGWAEVIAGSVAISGGGVVFAIGVVLVRLESLRDALVASAAGARSAQAAGTAQTVTPPSEPVGEPSRPLSSPDTMAAVPADAMLPPAPALVPEPEPEPSPDVADQGLWKRIKRPADTPLPPIDDQAFPDRAPAAAPEITSGLDGGRDTAPAVADTPASPAVDAPSPPLRAEAAQAAPEETAQLGWLERSLFKGRGSKEREVAARETSEHAGRVEPAVGDMFAPAAERSLAPEPSPAVHAETAAEAPPTAPHDEGPTVIGRYQAGVASYVMYSDGTIEVETEGGQSHRFGSMDELKAFIAEQDQAGG